AILISLVSIASCMMFEFFIQKYLLKQQPTLNDGSAILTGLLLAFNLPSNLPIGLIILGAFVAVGVGKMTFGGLGNNPFNPALVGRVFLLISFPVQMTSWPKPTGFTADVVTGATPLGLMKEGLKNGESVNAIMAKLPSHMEMFYGHMGGSMGEVAAVLLILGGLYMIVRKIITWHIPVFTLGTVAVFTGILNYVSPEMYAGPVFHLLTGGVMLGAIYMATDYVTSPMSKKGMAIFGIGIGVITVVIRVFGAYPEGISFAILIMNAFVPLINAYIKPKRFGEEVKNG
ncbi:MAG: RnfABCDGE type electron transport complex subunit D, partial [Bacteroidales bacterium]|nr:RnfABCDGE type electron transport complex subunit D [Bacteroidales bacterium]